MSAKQEEVDISIIVLTYCHEVYIAQALDSILAQKTDLHYEILIGDDASTDATPEIIREYASHYPEIIRPVLRKENLGAYKNSWGLYNRAKGKYIAPLEGDDYWLDPMKLQKQWDFLESNPEYVGCCGKCLIVDKNGKPDYTQAPRFFRNQKVLTLENFLDGWNLPGQAGTMMYRNIFRKMNPEEYAIPYCANRNVRDKTLMLLLLPRGPFYCANEVLSCYRYVTQGGQNFFSKHYAAPYRNYDMFLYPCCLETWMKKTLGIRHYHGKRKEYRFCRFVEECVRTPSLKRLRCLGDMVVQVTSQ